MALIKCSECGNEVSDSAAACPKCGAPVKKKQKNVGCVTSAVVIIGAFALFSAILSDDDSPAASSTSANVASSTVAVRSSGNPAHDRLTALSDSERRVMFATLLQSGGESCQTATRSFFQGYDKDRNAYWNVACDSGHSYSVAVYSNATGSTKVVDCAVMEAVGANCWTKF